MVVVVGASGNEASSSVVIASTLARSGCRTSTRSRDLLPPLLLDSRAVAGCDGAAPPPPPPEASCGGGGDESKAGLGGDVRCRSEDRNMAGAVAAPPPAVLAGVTGGCRSCDEAAEAPPVSAV